MDINIIINIDNNIEFKFVDIHAVTRKTETNAVSSCGAGSR
jgi:hypothetical protein